MSKNELTTRLESALAARAGLFGPENNAAFRLFAGFYEGWPDLVADLYATTLVLYDYIKDKQDGKTSLAIAKDFFLANLPWINCVVIKIRNTSNLQARKGVVCFGSSPSEFIIENGVSYAIDLLINQDASFYLDNRNLRAWLIDNGANWQVLNTFAYTGSLGVAALAGGAKWVIQTDRSSKFLGLARRSAMASHLDLGKMKLRQADFFTQVARLKRSGELFDCVILDPPFFSSTSKGIVDLVKQSNRLINKVRPLVKDGGLLIIINNALFLSGKDFLQGLETLCQDGYLSIDKMITIPEDITGYPQTIINSPPADPSPFNHPTKIVIMKAKRKAQT